VLENKIKKIKKPAINIAGFVKNELKGY